LRERVKSFAERASERERTKHREREGTERQQTQSCRSASRSRKRERERDHNGEQSKNRVERVDYVGSLFLPWVCPVSPRTLNKKAKIISK